MVDGICRSRGIYRSRGLCWVAALSRGGGAGSAELTRCEGVRTSPSSSELSPNICLDNDDGEGMVYPS